MIRNRVQLAGPTLTMAVLSVLGAQVAEAKLLKGAKRPQIVMLSKSTRAVAGEYIVKMEEPSAVGVKTFGSMNLQFSKSGFQIGSALSKGSGLYLVKAKNMNLFSADAVNATQMTLASLRKMSGVRYVEPNYVYTIMGKKDEALPDDPKFTELWGLKNIGQKDSDGDAGKAGVDIKATEAWAISKGSRKIVVAVIDTGVNYNHPDLKDNMWSKTVKDKDGKDVVIHGFNAINDELDPMDDHGHGSHCAGTIGGTGNNGVGVTGVNWEVSIMGVKFLSASGGGTLDNAIKAIDWAAENGAHIMSNSWGGGGFSKALEESIQRAAAKGILFVAAAGNDGSNNDRSPTYPGGYQVANVVAVAATNNRDELTSWSNYGKNTVHLAAPGNNIVSTVLGDGYDSYSGTSMATPHVSGASALLLSVDNTLTPQQVIERLMKTSNKARQFTKKLKSGGRLNALALLNNVPDEGGGLVPPDAWKAPIISDVASEHPYAAKTKSTWTIKHEGATFLRVNFGRFETEERYDFVQIKDGLGNVVETLSGAMAKNGVSSEVQGDTLTVEFFSDDSVQKWGFEIPSYQWTDFVPKKKQPAPPAFAVTQ